MHEDQKEKKKEQKWKILTNKKISNFQSNASDVWEFF